MAPFLGFTGAGVHVLFTSCLKKLNTGLERESLCNYVNVVVMKAICLSISSECIFSRTKTYFSHIPLKLKARNPSINYQISAVKAKSMKTKQANPTALHTAANSMALH